MSRRKRKLQRAIPGAGMPGGASFPTMPGVPQSVYSSTFYGSQTKNMPTQSGALFSPGTPLVPIPGVNPGGFPIQWRFPVAINTAPVDRTMGNPDIPSFEQLRQFATKYHGVTLCERVWLDMVPRMKLNIGLREEVRAQGGEDKNYQKEITYFKKWFEKPDGEHNTHTWLRMALTDQTHIDELYIYRHRKRNGQLLGLRLVDGSQMKPLLNEWGSTPEPPEYAYQQYPWGLPGLYYSSDMLIHYQESPATYRPYGFSRVERIIFNINLAIRKLKKDLANYTAGNVPRGFVTVPPDLNWTPDQIDSYQQMFNAMIAGSPEQQAKLLFMQPGMEYTKIEEFLPDVTVDKFWLNTSASAYGLSMGDLSFTEDIHKSSGDSQQNVLYRRTVDPLAIVYARIMTESMENDFEPSLHGDLMEVTFGGFEEHEDEESRAKTLTMYTGAGILGLSNAAKLANLPEEPDAPHIGRVFMSKDGPVFLDALATPEMVQASTEAKLAGLQLAANPPEQGDEHEETSGEQTGTSEKAKGATNHATPSQPSPADNERGADHKRSAGSGEKWTGQEHPRSGDQTSQSAASEDSHRGMAEKTAERKGREQTGAIHVRSHAEAIPTQADGAQIWRRGSCTCDACQMNDGQVRQAGEVYPSGAMQPGGHEGCDCTVEPHNEELARADIKRWRSRALDDVKNQRPYRSFVSAYIPMGERQVIEQALLTATTADEVRAAFERAREKSGSELATNIAALFRDIEQRGSKTLSI